MEFTTLKIAGGDAIRVLNDHRLHYPTTGLYPFLIGDAEELGRIKGAVEFNEQDPPAIIAASFDVKTAEWIAGHRKEAEEYEFSPAEL
ncbi:MAG: hypothetical protein JOZ17_11965 [Acetobacteraceae bacterium]|nr:hypothetical protein [Acetobacteraceae bacterium]